MLKHLSILCKRRVLFILSYVSYYFRQRNSLGITAHQHQDENDLLLILKTWSSVTFLQGCLVSQMTVELQASWMNFRNACPSLLDIIQYDLQPHCHMLVISIMVPVQSLDFGVSMMLDSSNELGRRPSLIFWKFQQDWYQFLVHLLEFVCESSGPGLFLVGSFVLFCLVCTCLSA